MAVKAIPDGFHSVTPYLIVRGAKAAIDFYQRAFGAVERVRLPGPGGQIGHAEIEIGDSRIMLADEFPELGARAPETIGGSPVGLCIYLADVDAAFARAIAAGGTIERPLADQFYGDRSGTLRDPFGHQWTLATHIEEVSPQEMERRMAALGPHDPPAPGA